MGALQDFINRQKPKIPEGQKSLYQQVLDGDIQSTSPDYVTQSQGQKSLYQQVLDGDIQSTEGIPRDTSKMPNAPEMPMLNYKPDYRPKPVATSPMYGPILPVKNDAATVAMSDDVLRQMTLDKIKGDQIYNDFTAKVEELVRMGWVNPFNREAVQKRDNLKKQVESLAEVVTKYDLEPDNLEKKPGVGKWVNDNTWAGLSSFTSGVTGLLESVLNFADYALTLGGNSPAETGYNTLFPWVTGLNKAQTEEAGALAQKAAETNEASGSVMGAIGQYGIQTAMQALPNAVLAVVSGGSSLPATLAPQATGAASAIATRLATVAKSPVFGMAYVQNAGNAYNAAKAAGATEDEALSASILTGLVNSVIELTGGVETLPSELRGMSESAIVAWVKSMFQEGNEEVVQGVIERLTAKMVYKQDANLIADGTQNIFQQPLKDTFNQWSQDTDAVINPATALDEFASGVGGATFTGGGEVVADAVMKAAAKSANAPQAAQEDAEALLNSPETPVTPDVTQGIPVKTHVRPEQKDIQQQTAHNVLKSPEVIIAQKSLETAQKDLNSYEEIASYSDSSTNLKNVIKAQLEDTTGTTRHAEIADVSSTDKPYTVTIDSTPVNKFIDTIDTPDITPTTLAILNNIDTVVQNGKYAGGGVISQTTVEGKPSSVPYETFQTPVTVGGERYLVTFNVTASPTNDSGGAGNAVHSIEIEKMSTALQKSFNDVSKQYDINVLESKNDLQNDNELDIESIDGEGYNKNVAFDRKDYTGFNFNIYLRSQIGDPPLDMLDPHAHHILFKEGNRQAQKALVEEGQALLRRYGIDPIFGLENLVWAPNRITGQHDYKALKYVVDQLKEVEKYDGDYDDIVAMLKELGEKAASRRKT